MIREELHKAIENVVWRVNHPPIDILPGEHNSLLDALLEGNKCFEWAFITACNPYGKTLNQLLNFRRHEALREKLHHYRLFEGEIVILYRNEPSEKGFLILGMMRGDAAKIGLLFEQNAIVVGRKGEASEIITLG